jgi:hypothetical protein
MLFGKFKHCVAPVSKNGAAHRSRVYPRSAPNVRKSGKPDLRCSRRRARGCKMWRGQRAGSAALIGSIASHANPTGVGRTS